MYRYITLFVLILIPFLAEAQAKRALSLIEKYKYDQAEDLLYKSLGKDSLQAGEKYLLSVLYFTEDYYNYNVDSAYNYVLLAMSDFKKSDEKTIEQLGKDDISLITIKTQKDKIEEFTFKKARKINTEQAYLDYLNIYNSSILADSAIWYRNKAAYQDASRANNWETYKSFMEKYPQAEDFMKAKNNFQKLVFEEKTGDGKLVSYENFLLEFPDSPFRKEVEKEIFKISTGTNRTEDYITFIKKYPESQLCKLSSGRIYHILQSKGHEDDFPALCYKYLDLDSLKKLGMEESSIWFPVLENSNYRLIDQNGLKHIDLESYQVPGRYLCGNLTDPLILSFRNDTSFIFNRFGNLVFRSTEIEDLSDLGYGYIQINNKNKYGLISKSGEVILPAIAEQIKIIQGQYAAFQVNDLWGLVSINGMKLFEPSFTNIEEFSTLIRIYRKDLFALVKTEELSPLMDNEDISLDFQYEDAELLSNGSIITYSGDKQGILSSDLEVLVPEEDQELIQLDKVLLIETQEGFRLISSEIDINPSLLWESADYNTEWISLKGPNGWTLVSIPLGKVVEEYIDSVRILNRSTSLVTKNKESRLYFHSGKKVKLERGSNFEIISSPLSTTVESEFYTLLIEKDKKHLLNSSGDTLITGNINDIKAFGNEYLVITERKGSGLFDSKGHRLLPSEFDGIANYETGGITLLKNGKLGYYRLRDSTYISPIYSKSVKQYNDQLFIANLKEGFGLITGSNKGVTEFSFEDISYFSDSTAWVKKEGKWNLYKFYEDTYLVENISQYNSFENGSNNYTYFQTDDGKGVLDRKSGTIINATFTKIINVGSQDEPSFMAAKYVDEADYYVVVYYDKNGKLIYRQAYPSEKYESLICKK